MTYESLHELEYVELRSPSRRSTRDLVAIFKGHGFTLSDDVLFLARKGRLPPWQHSSIAEVRIECDGEEVFGFDEGEWTSIRLEYLFATLPFELVDRFIEAADAISRELGTPMLFRGTVVKATELRDIFEQINADLVSSTGEMPGSDGVAILIQSTHPRR